jgi:hypothetical protein
MAVPVSGSRPEDTPSRRLCLCRSTDIKSASASRRRQTEPLEFVHIVSKAVAYSGASAPLGNRFEVVNRWLRITPAAVSPMKGQVTASEFTACYHPAESNREQRRYYIHVQVHMAFGYEYLMVYLPVFSPVSFLLFVHNSAESTTLSGAEAL